MSYISVKYIIHACMVVAMARKEKKTIGNSKSDQVVKSVDADAVTTHFVTSR